ncbi:peptidyl-prolyl cis-trans isomerase, FKBP-type family protein [Bacteroidales bacterium KA00344]|nr:peptidyl-prolyl cis-trans isomerase, FKBP-type family protein [Bacteroidales bacterium KA00344]
MKKILLLAMIFMASASMSTIQAGKKKDKDKKKENTEKTEPIVLASQGDSLSFAAGYAATTGLLGYLQNQLHVDTAYIAEFVRGYNEMLAKGNDPAYTAYMAGTQIANQAKKQILPGMSKNLEGSPDSIRSAIFHQGFLAGVREDTTIYTINTARELFETKSKEVKEAKNAAYKAENIAWLKDNATKPGVNVMPSGLQYKVLKTGSGPKPTAEQTVEVVYEGKTIDGNIFDATSRHHGKKTDSFRCNQVIKGWTEALTNMTVGSKWEIYIPQELAYGANEAGQIKPYSTLIFTVELVGIEQPENSTSTQKK